MTTEIVKRGRGEVSANPFASNNAMDNISQGTVSVEQERAIAETQGRMIIANRFKRDEQRAFDKILKSCDRLGFAEAAAFKYNRGSSVVTGPTIRLAEELARCWGNIDFGIRELSQDEGFSEMEAYCWDMETNVISKQAFTVKHVRDLKNGGQPLTSQRDIYEISANMGARRLRARIMSILPPDLIERAIEKCAETVRSGGRDGPAMEDRVRLMISRFSDLGITIDAIEEYLGHKTSQVLPHEFADLTVIYQSVKEDESRAGEWFGAKSKAREGADGALDSLTGTDSNSEPAAKTTKRTGAKATRPTATKPVAETEAPAEKEKPAPAETKAAKTETQEAEAEKPKAKPRTNRKRKEPAAAELTSNEPLALGDMPPAPPQDDSVYNEDAF